MFRPLSRTALAGVLLTSAACSRPSAVTAPPVTIPEPPAPDLAQEAAYREHLDAGRTALGAKDTAAAVTHFESAVAAKPKGFEAHLALARAWAAKKDDEKAIQAYDAALDLNPRLGDASLERAALLERAGRLEEARREYGRLIGQEIDPKLTAKGYWLRSELADRLGKRADYRYDREQALKLDPAYEPKVTGGDVVVLNQTERPIEVTIDRLTAPDGTERTFPPGYKFQIAPVSSAYLTEGDRHLPARWVRVTITLNGLSKSYTASYEKGLSLEVPISPEHLPR